MDKTGVMSKGAVQIRVRAVPGSVMFEVVVVQEDRASEITFSLSDEEWSSLEATVERCRAKVPKAVIQ
jgi:hypothetical protein